MLADVDVIVDIVSDFEALDTWYILCQYDIDKLGLHIFDTADHAISHWTISFDFLNLGLDFIL